MNALGSVVAEIERHVALRGWDQQPRLYAALVPTEELLRRGSRRPRTC